MTKETTSRPHSGSCDVTPEKGKAAMTKFRASCINWQADEDGPMTYEFRFNTGKFIDCRLSRVPISIDCTTRDSGKLYLL